MAQRLRITDLDKICLFRLCPIKGQLNSVRLVSNVIEACDILQLSQIGSFNFL